MPVAKTSRRSSSTRRAVAAVSVGAALLCASIRIVYAPEAAPPDGLIA
jgi:hypothetical protein